MSRNYFGFIIASVIHGNQPMSTDQDKRILKAEKQLFEKHVHAWSEYLIRTFEETAYERAMCP